MSGLVAHDLSGYMVSREVSHETDGVATGGTEDEV
jgi:hypothetical protein